MAIVRETFNWDGYVFDVCHHHDNWPEVPGLYIFAGVRSESQGIRQWQALYVGETQDFSARIPNHENWPAAVRLGATHVHARVEPDREVREAIESYLIKVFQPPLNVQLR